MKTIQGKQYKALLCETLEDINICRFVELQIYLKRNLPTDRQLSMLIIEPGEPITSTDETFSKEKVERLDACKWGGISVYGELQRILSSCKKTLNFLFPDDFSADEYTTDLIKQVLLLKCDYYHSRNYFNEGMADRIKELEDQILSEKGDEPGILEIYQAFETICFSMSQADGIMTVKQIKEQSVYEFYTHKKNLKEKYGRERNHTV